MTMNSLSKFWEVKDNGFLPTNNLISDAFSALIESKYKRIALDMPEMSRQQVVEYFNDRSQDIENDLNDIVSNDRVDLAENLMRVLSYAASFYVHYPEEPKVNVLPKAIAAPFVRVANLVERPPILSYASYCLYNWKHEFPPLRVELYNINLIQNFCKANDARRDEDWFILVHVDIENKAARGIKALQGFHLNESVESVQKRLTSLVESLALMNVTMKRMPEQCDPDVYYLKVRPYIFSFENIIYEGEFGDQPQTFRGETGAQSSIVPAFQTWLGVQHKENLLTTHLKDMRNYMPLEHRNFLTNLEQQPTVRDFVLLNINNLQLRVLYNSCVHQLYEFRRQHLQYAVDYIQKKVPNPKGTGGTPYVPWLSKLAEETESYYL